MASMFLAMTFLMGTKSPVLLDLAISRMVFSALSSTSLLSSFSLKASSVILPEAVMSFLKMAFSAIIFAYWVALAVVGTDVESMAT